MMIMWDEWVVHLLAYALALMEVVAVLVLSDFADLHGLDLLPALTEAKRRVSEVLAGHPVSADLLGVWVGYLELFWQAP